ncbi:MAG: hypothetical protein GX621_00245 [Pirellulaceae bacterium]|nr:hypothetical protein [Pirellulaceae bacterium]
MELLVTNLVAAAVILASVGLMWWHLRVRQRHRREELSPTDYDFHRRQFRRRIQTSAMLGILGILIAASSMVEPPMVKVLFYVGMLGLTLWIVLLAMADAVVSRVHYARLRNDCVVERARLEIEARRLRAGGNGKARGEPTERGDNGSR